MLCQMKEYLCHLFKTSLNTTVDVFLSDEFKKNSKLSLKKIELLDHHDHCSAKMNHRQH